MAISRNAIAIALAIAVSTVIGACESGGGARPGPSGSAGSTGASGATGGAGAGAGATGSAGATGAAGGGAAGVSGAGGGAGDAAADGGAGSSAAGAGGNGGAPGSDGAASDGPADGAPGEGGIPHQPFTGTAKIMVLGSSNEEGTCWRAFLWQKLRAAGVMNFEFVGRNNAGPDCGVPGYDKDSEAHGGTVVTNISAGAWLTTFMANPPDIILQHNGGADLLNGIDYMKVLTAYTLSVKQARMVSPKVIYFAAQHTPQGSAANNEDVKVLNAAMIPWGAGLTTADSPLVIVDLFTGVDQKTDTSDGTHLNVSGSQKVSDRFLALLLPLFKP